MLLNSLNASSLRSIAGRMGFKHTDVFEKFIADFDAHASISNKIPCHVRGGLCFPFHVPDMAHRLSVDLDLYTPTALDIVSDVVPGLLIDGGFTKALIHPMPVGIPSIRNLIRFIATFKSNFGINSKIHVDIVCGISPETIDTSTVPTGYGLLGIRTEHTMSVLSRGSLIADKITSLGLDTIGYRSLRSTPKQIYDIGQLIQHSSIKDISSMISTYEKLTKFKLSNTDRVYTQQEVIASVVSYLRRLRNEATPDHDQYWSHFKTFSTTMLPTHQQAKKDHVEQILLVSICAQSLARSLEPGASHADEAAHLRAAVDETKTRRESGTHLAFLRERLGRLAP